MEIKGKSALVTGGATGIGLMYCRELLKNGVHRVLMADINANVGEESAMKLNIEFGKDRVLFKRCDVTDTAELEETFRMAQSTFKGLDIVINNAGVMDDERWEMQIVINVNALVRGTMLGLQYMGKDKGGRGGVVVNIASILGLQPMAGCPVYVGTKHAVLGFTRSMAMPFHYNRTGVRMLTMCPGVTDTVLISGAIHRQMQSTWGVECERELKALRDQQPEKVAQAMMRLIIKGENGGVWVCEAGECYKVEIPDRLTLRGADI